MTRIFSIFRMTALIAVLITTVLLAGCGGSTSSHSSAPSSHASTQHHLRQSAQSVGGYLAAMKACAPETANQALIDCLKRHGAGTTAP